MSLTLTILNGFLAQALDGGDPSVIDTDAATTKRLIANLAGRHLVAMEAWKFMERPATALQLTISQAYVNLPADFSELVAVAGNATGIEFIKVGFDDLALKRQDSGAPATGTYWYTLAQPGQATDASDFPVPRLEVYPTPAATVANALNVTYRAAWTELTAVGKTVNIPQWAELLLVALVQAFARGLEHDTLAAEIEAVEAGPIATKARLHNARLIAEATRPPLVEDRSLRS